MTHSLSQFAKDLTVAGVSIGIARHEILEEACRIIEKEAKRVIGTYDYGWPPLKPETIARKAHGDTPLLETGEMRESISHDVEFGAGHGYVGSPMKIALYQELGTRTIPPRSFLGGASMRKEHDIHEMIGMRVHGTIVKQLA